MPPSDSPETSVLPTPDGSTDSESPLLTPKNISREPSPVPGLRQRKKENGTPSADNGWVKVKRVSKRDRDRAKYDAEGEMAMYRLRFSLDEVWSLYGHIIHRRRSYAKAIRSGRNLSAQRTLRVIFRECLASLGNDSL
jgi:hypothetical protein